MVKGKQGTNEEQTASEPFVKLIEKRVRNESGTT